MTRREDDMPWTTIITPRRGWLDIGLGALWEYRDLVLLLVRRDFVSRYKQTILGPVWFVLQPLLMTVVFTVVFGRMAGLSTDGVPGPLFYFAGVVCWRYFAACLTKTSDTFVANAAIFGKVYFPRLAVPVSVVLSNLFTFALQFAFFLVLHAFYASGEVSARPGAAVAVVPLLVAIMAALGLGGGILVSSLTTRYRDLRFLIGFGVQLLMYLTPIIYPLSSVPEDYRLLVLANPMTEVVEAFRYVFLGQGAFTWARLAYSAGASALVLVCGLALFSRVEKTFMDTV